MPRGEKAGNAGVKPHRARRIAAGLMERGAPRAAANELAAAAMDREYAPERSANPRRARHAFDTEAHDSRTGQRKTRLTTKKGQAVSGASKPAAAKKPASTKRNVKASGSAGGAASGRRPRASSDPATLNASARQSTAGRRPPKPRTAAGAKKK